MWVSVVDVGYDYDEVDAISIFALGYYFRQLISDIEEFDDEAHIYAVPCDKGR
jgi:hypothetical protein